MTNLSRLKEMEQLTESLQVELGRCLISEECKLKICRKVLGNVKHFQLDPLSQLEIYYLEVLDLQEGVFNEDENISTYPAIAIFFDKRKWLFNALTGECLVNEPALSNEKPS